mmetsp:Transcript_51748/g.155308  ORF Transcript_51748/g.155308 Transcript_51748/m.155308 type:complete len:90 (+) Transcript_51748:91-360(+)
MSELLKAIPSSTSSFLATFFCFNCFFGMFISPTVGAFQQFHPQYSLIDAIAASQLSCRSFKASHDDSFCVGIKLFNVCAFSGDKGAVKS